MPGSTQQYDLLHTQITFRVGPTPAQGLPANAGAILADWIKAIAAMMTIERIPVTFILVVAWSLIVPLRR